MECAECTYEGVLARLRAPFALLKILKDPTGIAAKAMVAGLCALMRT